MANHKKRPNALKHWACELGSDPPPPQLEVVIPAATQQAITGFVDYLMVERRLARSTQTTYRGDVHRFFTAYMSTQDISKRRIHAITPGHEPALAVILTFQRSQGRRRLKP